RDAGPARPRRRPPQSPRAPRPAASDAGAAAPPAALPRRSRRAARRPRRAKGTARAARAPGRPRAAALPARPRPDASRRPSLARRPERLARHVQPPPERPLANPEDPRGLRAAHLLEIAQDEGLAQLRLQRAERPLDARELLLVRDRVVDGGHGRPWPRPRVGDQAAAAPLAARVAPR